MQQRLSFTVCPDCGDLYQMFMSDNRFVTVLDYVVIKTDDRIAAGRQVIIYNVLVITPGRDDGNSHSTNFPKSESQIASGEKGEHAFHSLLFCKKRKAI